VDEAISLLRRGFPEPFCCFLPLSLVHPPYAVDEPWFSMYDPEKIDEIIPPPATGKATHFDAVHRATGMDAGGDALARKLRACYYGMMSKQDANFGRLVDVLEETGLADRTATLFMADHGNYAGDFGSPTKWWSGTEDSLLRVPCAIRLPGGEQEAGIRDGMIQTLDVARTLLELAGVDPEWPHFGRSLVAGMTGGESVRREAVFADSGFTPDHENPATLERSGLPRTRPSGTYYAWRRLGEERPELFARARTVRTQQWKYVWRAAESDELYDLAADPQERRNLLYKDADAYHDRVAEMRSLMLDWSIRCGDVVPPRCHD
jgi:arylsulfatase A-like enzyme